MARPLKIPLGIDFSRFDRDLRGIADKIEGAGRAASISVGGNIGQMGAGSLDTAALGQAVAQVGMQLSTGIANGIRAASSSMGGFVAHIDAMFNRLAGTAITMFERIDAAMKFPKFDAFFTSSKMTLGRWVTFWKKPLTDVDKAMGGVFGDKIAMLTTVLKSLIDSLAAEISGALKSAIGEVVAQFALMNQGARQAEASAGMLLGTMQKTAQAANQFDMGSKGMKGTVPGRRIQVVDQEKPGRFDAVFAAFQRMQRNAQQARQGMATMFGPAAKVGGEVLRNLGAEAVLAGRIGRAGLSLIPVAVLGIAGPIIAVKNYFFGLAGVSKKTYDDIYGGSKKAGAAVAAMQAPLNLAKGATAAVGQTAKGLGSIFTSTGAQILAAFGVAGLIYKAVQFLKDGVVAASDLNESVSRSKVVFGGSFGPVEGQVNAMSKAFGLNRRELYDMESGFGAIASGAGFSEKASASLAMQMTQMAADLSSSVNIPLEEAGTAIRSSLAGESEPLRRFGANILDANVKAKMAAAGFKDMFKAMMGGKAPAAASPIAPPTPKKSLGDVLGSQAQKDATATKNASKMVGDMFAAGNFNALDAVVAGRKDANADMLRWDAQSQAVSVNMTAKSAMEARAKWRAGLTSGPMPALPMPPTAGIQVGMARTATAATATTGAVGKLSRGTEDQRKIAARAMLVTEGLSYAVGDLDRTQGAAANQFRKAGGGVAEFGTRIGELLLPAVALVTKGFNELMVTVLSWVESNKPAIEGWGQTLVTVVKGVFAVLTNLGTVWEIAKLQVGAFVNNTIAWFRTIPANFGNFMAWIGRNWKQLLTDLAMNAKTYFTGVGMNIKNFGVAMWSALQGGGFDFKWTNLTDGFQSTTEKLPELIRPQLQDVTKQTDEMWAKIFNPVFAAQPPIPEVGPPKPPPGPEEMVDKTKGEYKLAAVAEVGSKEAASILARAMTPGAQRDKASQQLGVAKDSNATLKKIEAKMSAPVQLAVK